MTTKHLTLSDIITQSDKHAIQDGESTTLKGIVSMRDNETNRIVFSRRNNLIMLRGRTFALEKLFNSTIDNSAINSGVRPYLSNLNRKISGFAVGRGGAVSPSTPFEPNVVNPIDRWTASEVPFRIHDTRADESQPQLFVPNAERIYYSDGRATDNTNQRAYYMKQFDNFDPVWNYDESSNEVYKLIQMSIGINDCRTHTQPMVNELALVIAENLTTNDANGMPEFSSIEIFSKIHFPTEFLSVGKSLSIEYLVYA